MHLVYTLERIYSQYKQTNSDFVVKKYRNQHPQKRADTTFESVAKSYFNNIIKLLWMIQDNILIMMRNPLLNYNDIKDNIDQVLYYSGKLSYNDTVRMPISFDIFEKLKKVNSQLEAEMKKNSKSAE